MSIRVIIDRKEIEKHQDTLAKVLRRGVPDEGNIGAQGGHLYNDMYWFPKEHFWWSYDPPGSGNRHWNAFGYEEEFNDAGHSITCEINFPKSRGTWRIAGAFAKDEDGEIYIVHSGKIGGGRKGVGMTAFKQHYAKKPWISVEKAGKQKDVVVVSALHDEELLQNIAYFVKSVHWIKSKITGKAQVGGKAGKRPTFTSEYHGPKSYSTRERIRANVTHGKIVDSLQRYADNMGIKTWNDKATDLFLERKTTAMAEVKTGKGPYDRYTAVGQLLYHRMRFPGRSNVKLIAVFPSFGGGFDDMLEKLGIVGVRWRKVGHGYKFDRRLDDVLKRL